MVLAGLMLNWCHNGHISFLRQSLNEALPSNFKVHELFEHGCIEGHGDLTSFHHRIQEASCDFQAMFDEDVVVAWAENLRILPHHFMEGFVEAFHFVIQQLKIRAEVPKMVLHSHVRQVSRGDQP